MFEVLKSAFEDAVKASADSRGEVIRRFTVAGMSGGSDMMRSYAGIRTSGETDAGSDPSIMGPISAACAGAERFRAEFTYVPAVNVPEKERRSAERRAYLASRDERRARLMNERTDVVLGADSMASFKVIPMFSDEAAEPEPFPFGLDLGAAAPSGPLPSLDIAPAAVSAALPPLMLDNDRPSELDEEESGFSGNFHSISFDRASDPDDE